MPSSSPIAPDIRRLNLVDAVAGLTEGAFTARQLAGAYLARIRTYEEQVRAWAWLDEERVLACADRSDEERRRGNARPLCGIPLAIKDIFHTRGLPTRMGSPAFEDFVPQDNAACIDRLEAAGAYVQGKSVSTEFATQHPGPTRNPWNTGRTPGGSSSGSAAAVAAGLTCAALGTQTRGSIVRPAAYCGVVGYKPSFGLIARDGVLPLSETLDHVGVLTRCVADAALLTPLMMDTASAEGPRVARELGDSQPLRNAPRLAAVRTPSWSLADPAQQLAFGEHCDMLARAAGRALPLIELPPRFTRDAEVTKTIQEYEIARNFRDLKQRSGHLFSASFIALCERGEAIARAAYEDALGLRRELCRDADTMLADWDAIVTPSALGEALPTLARTGDPAFCTPWTLCGLPAVSIPSGFGPAGMPLAVQIVGRLHDDARVLRAAAWCERQFSFNRTPLP